MIFIRLRKCNGKDYCRSEDEIDSFLSTKYLIFASNEVRFNAQKYSHESVDRQAKISWFKILSESFRSIPMKVTKTTLDSQNKYINLDEITEYYDDNLLKYEMIE